MQEELVCRDAFLGCIGLGLTQFDFGLGLELTWTSLPRGYESHSASCARAPSLRSSVSVSLPVAIPLSFPFDSDRLLTAVWSFGQ